MKHGGNMRTRNANVKREIRNTKWERELEIFVPNPNLIVTETNCSGCWSLVLSFEVEA